MKPSPSLCAHLVSLRAFRPALLARNLSIAATLPSESPTSASQPTAFVLPAVPLPFSVRSTEQRQAAGHYVGIKDAIQNDDLELAQSLYVSLQAKGVEPATVTEYTILINLHCKTGHMQTAYELFARMKRDDLQPNTYTYCALLAALFRVKQPEPAFALMEEIKRGPVKPDVYIYHEVLEYHAAALDRVSALACLDEMLAAGVAPDHWTFMTLFRLLIRLKDVEASRALLSRMRALRVRPDVKVYTLLLNLFTTNDAFEEATQLYREFRSEGIQLDIKFYEAALLLFLKTQNTPEILRVFQELKQDPTVKPDTICYNILVHFFCSHPLGKFPEEVIGVYKAMKGDNVQPNIFTYNKIIDMFYECGQLEFLRIIVDDMVASKESLDLPNSVLAYGFNALISLVCAQPPSMRTMIDVKDLITAMKRHKITPSVISYNLYLKSLQCISDRSFAGQASISASSREETPHPSSPGKSPPVAASWKNRAHFVYSEMIQMGVKPDVVTFSTLIDIYRNYHMPKRAIKLYKEMKKHNIQPNQHTYNSLILMYAHHWPLEAIRFFRQLKADGLVPNRYLYTTMINIYARRRQTNEAIEVFSDMMADGVLPDVVTFTQIISMFAARRQEAEVLLILQHMRAMGVAPNRFTYTAVISLYIGLKRREEAYRYLDEMKSLNIQPDKLTLEKFRTRPHPLKHSRRYAPARAKKVLEDSLSLAVIE